MNHSKILNKSFKKFQFLCRASRFKIKSHQPRNNKINAIENFALSIVQSLADELIESTKTGIDKWSGSEIELSNSDGVYALLMAAVKLAKQDPEQVNVSPEKHEEIAEMFVCEALNEVINLQYLNPDKKPHNA